MSERPTQQKILFVGQKGPGQLFGAALEDAGFEYDQVKTLNDVPQKLETARQDLILIDIDPDANLTTPNVLEQISALKKNCQHLLKPRDTNEGTTRIAIISKNTTAPNQTTADKLEVRILEPGIKYADIPRTITQLLQNPTD